VASHFFVLLVDFFFLIIDC